MTSAISRDARNVEGQVVWERDGKRCARCRRELPDFRDCRTDKITPGDDLCALCVPCYILRGDARRWRTANIGVLVAAGILPKNWRDLVWFENEIKSA